MNDASTIPKDGTRILVKYRMKRNVRGKKVLHGDKWEECRWKDDDWSPGEFESWCGYEEGRTTRSFKEDRVLGWLPLPEGE
jgi:hypothetical protein